MIEEQWRDLSHLPDRPPMPDYERARDMEAAGALKVWTARRDGELLGFIQWRLYCPLGYVNLPFAVDGGWYFSRDEGNSFLALAMWRAAEAALRGLGVEIMQGHDNEKRRLLPFFRRLGMPPVATIYQKDLI